jgi:hypothetical protein
MSPLHAFAPDMAQRFLSESQESQLLNFPPRRQEPALFFVMRLRVCAYLANLFFCQLAKWHVNFLYAIMVPLAPLVALFQYVFQLGLKLFQLLPSSLSFQSSVLFSASISVHGASSHCAHL